MSIRNALTKDLTANLDAKQKQGVAYGILAVSAVVGVTGGIIGGPALVASIAGLFGGLVVLRIVGPKDAKSFRLYKAAAAA